MKRKNMTFRVDEDIFKLIGRCSAGFGISRSDYLNLVVRIVSRTSLLDRAVKRHMAMGQLKQVNGRLKQD